MSRRLSENSEDLTHEVMELGIYRKVIKTGHSLEDSLNNQETWKIHISINRFDLERAWDVVILPAYSNMAYMKEKL